MEKKFVGENEGICRRQDVVVPEEAREEVE
jgi:hypothetical protein